MSTPSIRLQKFIADCGHTSRRKAEVLIEQGLVKVNGHISNVLGTKVDPQSDVVEVEGQVLDPNRVEKVYLVMNKPRGSVTTLSDPEGRPTIMDLVKEVPERVYPVGRLDYLSEGLLVLTNDGELANFIMHPKYKVTKVYEVKVFGLINKTLLKSLRAGVSVDGDFLKPLNVRVIKELPSKTWLEFRLGEGKNREIRKICEAHGLTVDKLKRVAIEGLSVDDISPGKFRYTTRRELLKLLGMKEDGSKSNKEKEYISFKRSVKLKDGREGTLANDKIFTMFRKESYYEASKSIQTNRKLRKGPRKGKS